MRQQVSSTLLARQTGGRVTYWYDRRRDFMEITMMASVLAAFEVDVASMIVPLWR